MDFIAHLKRQIAWSISTFGPAERRKGVLDHIRKEIAEVENGNGDPDEWIDLIILSIDGCWRSIKARQEEDGIFFTENRTEVIARGIAERLDYKQARNEFRTWPDWRGKSEDVAIEHDRNKA